MSAQAEPKIAKDVAEGEFRRWADAMGLSRKFDPATLTDDDKRGLASTTALLVGAMQEGALLVDPEGRFVFTPRVGKDQSAITFEEPDGNCLIAMDAAKQGADQTRRFKALAAMTGQSVPRFSAMKARDLEICIAIFVLFLAS